MCTGFNVYFTEMCDFRFHEALGAMGRVLRSQELTFKRFERPWPTTLSFVYIRPFHAAAWIGGSLVLAAVHN